MRDLAVHDEDLIVATHGRSFWILDDITPLRQMNAEIAEAPVTLYRPQEAIRFRGTAIQIHRFRRTTPRGRTLPTARSSITIWRGPPASRLRWRFSMPIIIWCAASRARIKRSPWRRSPLQIPFRCIGCDPSKFCPRKRVCTVSFGICTTRRRDRSTTNSPFPLLCTTHRSCLLAHGPCRDSTCQIDDRRQKLYATARCSHGSPHQDFRSRPSQTI